jgi:hypothetical protein
MRKRFGPPVGAKNQSDYSGQNPHSHYLIDREIWDAPPIPSSLRFLPPLAANEKTTSAVNRRSVEVWNLVLEPVLR